MLSRNVALGAAGALVGYKVISSLFTPTPRNLKDKLVLVTGAANGIGRLMSFEFARRGARLILWDIQAEALDKVAVEIRSAIKGVSVSIFTCNLANKESVNAAAADVKKTCGDPDVVVGNAGVVSGTFLLDSPDSKNELTFAVNSLAHFWTTKAFLPAMVKKNEGSIVVVASMAAVTAAPAMVDYSASKAAAKAFAEGLSLELKYLSMDGITVSCICPVHINTGLFKGFSTGATNITLDAKDVALATVEAVVHRKELVILPWYIGLTPVIKGMFEACGRLGLPILAQTNPMGKWKSGLADDAFKRMQIHKDGKVAMKSSL